MDSQEDSVSAVSPGLLVSLVECCKPCLNWIYPVCYRQVLRKRTSCSCQLAGRGFLSSVGGMDSQEDSASAV